MHHLQIDAPVAFLTGTAKTIVLIVFSVVLGLEHKVSHMLGKHSTIELQPQATTNKKTLVL
jgi:hypothetical protein